VTRDPLGLVWISAYIGVFVDAWVCRLDHEDSSTAPFSALSAQETESMSGELETCMKVLTE
jgi:hypothetical protein